ncbi:MAG: polysaccharide deacetylase family protein [Candidatus Omnitrophica bacterium]|nr:polysaccharide deacetylase family protein [Candidatus Omnitrophota bacterium]
MKLPILLYHDIKEDNFDIATIESGNRPYVMRQSDFEAQMSWLYDNGYRAIGIDEIETATDKSVLLVFDDGLKSNFDIAYPILKRYGFKAVFFVTVDDIGKRDIMSWQELKELKDNGMSIGSHSMSHRVPIELSDNELKYELFESKKVLEKNLGKRIDYFSLPTGFYDKRITTVARDAAYKGLFYSEVGYTDIAHSSSLIAHSKRTTGPDIARSSSLIAHSKGTAEPAAALFQIYKKIGIKRGYDLWTFRALVEQNTGVLFLFRLNQMFRNLAKSFLGSKNYIKLKSIVLRKAL